MALDQHFDDLEERKEKEMSFIEHLEELRWHVFRSVIAVFVIALATFAAKKLVFDWLIFGPIDPSFPTYRVLCSLSKSIGVGEAFCIDAFEFNIINIEVAGQFLVHLKVSLVLGTIIAFPYIFWEFWRFVSPALHKKERKSSRGVVFWSSFLFILGISFGYLVLAPFSINFFGNYGVSEMVDNQWKLTNYVSIITMITMVSGIIFEMPMIAYFGSKFGLLTPDFMRSHRRHALVLTLVIAALITPADVGTQILVSIPMVFLYEISIIICSRVYKKRQKQLA